MPAVVAATFQNGRPLFDQSCYYAPADKDFILKITNTIFALDDKTPARLTLLISDSDNPAVTPGLISWQHESGPAEQHWRRSGVSGVSVVY